MGRLLRITGFLCILTVALSACASGSPATSSGGGAPGGTLAQLKPAGSHDLFQALIHASRDLGPLAASRHVSFLLTLKDPTASRQAADIAAMYDPNSPQFRHFKSLKQLAARYGPPAAWVNRVRALLRTAGLTVNWQPTNDWLQVSGSAGQIDRFFRVRIDRYLSSAGTPFWASSRDPVVPAALRRIVTGSGHISNYASIRPLIVPVEGLTPPQLLAAYDLTPLRSQGIDGAGQTVAFLEIDGFSQKDFDAFTHKYNLPPIHPVIKSGGALHNVDGEAELDMEVVHMIAPAAKLTVYNCADPCSNSDFITAETRAVRGTAHGVLSVSVGACEADETSKEARTEANLYNNADALGESVFVASGDSGAFDCLTENWSAAPTQRYLDVDLPAAFPGVTGVGGTRLSLNQSGTYYQEEVWENPAETAGGGGGVSTLFRRPAWQKGPGVQNSFNTTGARTVPDVSADADTESSPNIVVNGQLTQEGGTSQAAPIWAGMTSLINQYLSKQGQRSLGFMNPALYTLASSKQQFPPYHDVTVGTNLYYPATQGYDMASGLGTPDGWNLARDLSAYLRGGHR